MKALQVLQKVISNVAKLCSVTNVTQESYIQFFYLLVPFLSWEWWWNGDEIDQKYV